MNEGPNMSYCAIENTTSALRQACDIIEDLNGNYSSLNEYEQKNLPILANECVEFINMVFGHLREVELLDLIVSNSAKEEMRKIMKESVK